MNMRLRNISFSYWIHQKKRFIKLVSIMIIAVASIVAVGLLLRSEKEYLLKTELDYLGNYDGIIYDISENDYQQIERLENIDVSGYYKEMGLCGIDSETKYMTVSFPDFKSISLYHMSMIRGNYPEKKNEIAIDSGVAKLMGIKPEVGKVISLNLYDFENNFVAEKDFIITGIFEGSNSETYGGWYRYPIKMDVDEYKMPAVIMSSDYEYINIGKNVTAFFQHSYENNIEFTDAVLNVSKDISEKQIDIPLGRSFAYSYVMGFSEGIYREYGELNPKTALKALKDGKGIKDFYSSVLIPVFVVLVCIISALSIYNAVRLNLRDRINNLSILRCIGMSSFTTFMLLFSEIIVLVLIACVLGYGFGSLLHMLMLCVLKNGWNIALTPGFTVSAYVKAVTFNPYVISGLTVVAFTVFASLIPLIRLAVKTPIAIKQTNIKLKHKGKTKRIMSVNKTWMRLLSERVSFFSVSIFLMYVFILGVIPFGYTYFHAMSDKQNIEYKYELEDSDLGHYDYTAYKSTLRNMSQFNVESRHYDGINEDAVNNLILSDDFDEVFAISEKYSTKISVKKDDENEDIHNLLGRTALRGQAVSNLTQEDREKSEEYYNSCLEAETEMIRKTGYTDDENIYAVPTVGLTYDRLAELENYVVDGDIDYEKIKNGEEVIIAVYEDDVDTALKVFRTGEYLPLSDVKLNDEEDHFDFYHLDYTKLEAAYEKNVMAPWDAEVTLHSYAFGKRTDIETKIGAIISLDEETANKYLALSENICGGTTEPGKFVPAVITLGTEVFDKWNLNSQKYTNVQVKLADDVDFETADNIWYDTIKDCSGISIQSAYEIRHKIYEKETQTMVIFYFVVISLIISGLICILISLDIKLITLQKEIALLRKIGMSVKQFILYLFIQSSWYPFIGTVLSIIPVTLMQRFFNMIASKIDSGEWEGVYGISTESDIPWYSNLPFRFNLFSYDFIKCLLCTFVVGWFIVVIASLPQIIREYKNKMVKE